MSAQPAQLRLPQQDKEQARLLSGEVSVEEPPSNPRTIIQNLEDISSNSGLHPVLSREHQQNHRDPEQGVQADHRAESMGQMEQEQQGSDSDRSQEEQIRNQQARLMEQLRANQQEMSADKKVVVGTGFNFDITDFFKFKKKQELASEGASRPFFDEITGSRLAWIILLYSVCNSAMIPGWIMNIKATKLMRQCWRFLMQALVVIPFLLYEIRTAPPENKEKYTLKYIFKPSNLIKPYASSLSSSLWFLMILSSFEWTFVSHGIVLGSISNFFLSIGRSYRKSSHVFESGGQMLVVLGVLLVMYDSYKYDVTVAPPSEYNYVNTFYMRRTWWERIGADIAAFVTSFFMAEFSKYTADLRSYYPPFLSLTLVHSFNFFNMGFVTFFCNGGTFDFDPFWGFFSIFTDSHFVSFLYMAIALAFGQMVSMFMITRMFPDPIIPALAMTLEPFIACFLVHLASVQNLPPEISMIGFIFILPGLIAILLGQCFFQKQKANAETSDKRVQELMAEIKALKEIKEQRREERITKLERKSKLYKSTALARKESRGVAN